MYAHTPVGVKHDSKGQSKVTMMIDAGMLWLYAKVLPHFDELLWRVSKFAFGMHLVRVHVLRQSGQGCGRQALFGWHTDSETEEGAELSFVFCLTDAPSSMWVAGAQPFHYMGKGSGCMFMSRIFHASGEATEGTMKVAFFFTVVK